MVKAKEIKEWATNIKANLDNQGGSAGWNAYQRKIIYEVDYHWF